jgi:hypothetical protein
MVITFNFLLSGEHLNRAAVCFDGDPSRGLSMKREEATGVPGYLPGFQWRIGCLIERNCEKLLKQMRESPQAEERRLSFFQPSSRSTTSRRAILSSGTDFAIQFQTGRDHHG